MDNVTAVPHADGIQILKDELYEEITKFQLLGDNGAKYYEADIHSIRFDTNGILTASCIVPKEEHFTTWNKWVRILSDDDKIIADVETPPIQWVKGVGGEQEIKLTVSGEAGEVVFKKDEYVTDGELEPMMDVVTQIWASSLTTQEAMLKHELSSI